MSDSKEDVRKSGLRVTDRDKLPSKALNDPFGPTDSNESVKCLHCGRVYAMNEIVWSDENGLWCCPFADCDGAGVGCDIFKEDSGVHC